MTLQSINSKVWGRYCLYYALFRCRNDFLVNCFIAKHFLLSLKTCHAHETFKEQKHSLEFSKYTMQLILLERVLLSNQNKENYLQ